MQDAPLVPAFRTDRYRSFPKHESGGAADYRELGEALRATYGTDAHMAAYSLPGMPRRLGSQAVPAPGEPVPAWGHVPMVAAVFDVDCPPAHKGDASSVTAWWLVEIMKVEALRRAHPHGFVYRTRSGYRIVYVLLEPVVLRTTDDAGAWKVTYCTWVAYLKRAFGIVADHACKDWTRLYRLPHATRDRNGAPEKRETIGDPTAIGAWNCSPSADDEREGRVMANRKHATRKRKPVASTVMPGDGKGLLFHAAHARGELGAEIEPGKFAVVCPNETAHTSGERFDTSTVLYSPSPGDAVGWLHCSHAHCQHLTLRNVLDHYSESELTAAREAAGLVSTVVPHPPVVGPDAPSGRPDIYIPGFHVIETPEGEEYFEISTDEFAQRALQSLPPDELYRMESVVGIVTGTPGRKKFMALDADTARQLVDRHMRLIQGVRKRDGEIVTIYKPCTRDFANLVLTAAAISAHVRDLQCVVRLPCYLPDYERAVPGWNEKGGVYFDEHPELTGVTPNADGAMELLADLLIDFPFKDDASRENVYGAMVTAMIRPALAGPIPFFILLASQERTGKGKCIDTALGMALTGSTVPMLQLSGSEEEREKRITSEIIAGTTTLHFDNIAGGDVIDSPALASLATSWPRWRGRLLGKSHIVTLPNRLLILLSGNNVKATGELCKRTVPIVLESPTPTPELRDDFVHPDIMTYAAERRRSVIEALLGLVESWKAAGMPSCRVRMGGFERWVAAIGGILTHAGCRAWMTNHRAWVVRADDEGADAGLLVDLWASWHGTAPITASQILTMIEELGVFSRVLAIATPAGQQVSIGRRVIPVLVDRHFGDWVVRRIGSGSSSRYALVAEPIAASPKPSSSEDGWSTL